MEPIANIIEAWDVVLGPLDPERRHRCYELSGMYIVENGEPDWELVHGTIQGLGNPPLDHAWVKESPLVYWEPRSGERFTLPVFMRVFSPRPQRTYLLDEAVGYMMETGHFGPWHA